MKLFVTFGSWGEIAPLLEIALQLKDRGEFVEFATTNWADRVEQYGVKCHRFPEARKHSDTLDDFLSAHLVGRMQSIYSVIEAAAPSSIVSSFYCLPSFAYAARAGIPCVATTTTPAYFSYPDPPTYSALMDDCGTLGWTMQSCKLIGIYPWYLAGGEGIANVGWPELRPLAPLTGEVAEFIKQPYGVVSRGTLVGGELERAVNAIKAHGLKCLYLGPHKCSADMSAFLDNHKEAVKHAKVAITHAGIGTTVDCMHVPMVVDPAGYDQFYNANRLVALKAAVGVKSTYISAITEALAPRSYLPNFFDLDGFLNANTSS
jgi:Glycosyltransferase family 28 C-terminal domain